ncbi:MAG TPA: hypothetical protein VLF87_00795 [Patescibacteria group bacterium]|nr:hypothetical protein [Patescibacteria group bacterium]
MAEPKKVIVDPSPNKFRRQALVVAIVLIILGILVFIIASAIAGGVIALLGAIFGLGSQVARDLPVE